MRKESAVVYFEILAKYLFGRTEEDKENFNPLNPELNPIC